MNVKIYDDETLEDLQCDNLCLIQKKKGFRFGTDAVLLSDFAKTVTSKKTLDLCTGTAIVPLLMSKKTNTKEFHAIEIQEDIADMAKRSISANGLESQINLICDDLKNSTALFPSQAFDLITCNPPYMKADSAILNSSDTKTISRHEVKCTLSDILSVSAKLLKYGGHLVMVHRPNRLCDVMFEMRKNAIEPKRIRFVHSSIEKPPVLFLIDGMNKANNEIKVLPPLVLYDGAGNESEELKMIYGRK